MIIRSTVNENEKQNFHSNGNTKCSYVYSIHQKMEIRNGERKAVMFLKVCQWSWISLNSTKSTGWKSGSGICTLWNCNDSVTMLIYWGFENSIPFWLLYTSRELQWNGTPFLFGQQWVRALRWRSSNGKDHILHPSKCLSTETESITRSLRIMSSCR